MNLNRRAMELDEEKYIDKINYLESKKNEVGIDNEERDRVSLLLDTLEFQYEDYSMFKSLSKSDMRRARRIEYGNLIGDKYSALMREGLSTIGFPYVYTIDLAGNLPLVLSMVFKEDHLECYKKIKNLAESKNTTVEKISRFFLSHELPCKLIGDINITYKDFFDLSNNMKEFFSSAMAKHKEYDKPILGCISQTDYSKIISVNEKSELPLSISLKLWEGVEMAILDSMIDITKQLKTNEINHLVASKFLSGFTIYCDREINLDTSINMNNRIYTLPIDKIK